MKTTKADGRGNRPLQCAALVAAVAVAAEGEMSYRAVLEANPEMSVACSFTASSKSSERPDEQQVERFTAQDGAAGGEWRLVSVNGEAPSADALEDYADGAEQRQNRSEEPAGAFHIGEMVEAESAVVVAEDAQTTSFRFKQPASAEEEGPDPEKMSGVLVVDKHTLRPLRATITNTEPISPAPTVKIAKLLQEYEFLVEPATNAVVLASMSFAVEGKAMIFKKISEAAEIRFSDYDCEMRNES